MEKLAKTIEDLRQKAARLADSFDKNGELGNVAYHKGRQSAFYEALGFINAALEEAESEETTEINDPAQVEAYAAHRKAGE
jgi:predicted outer membrane protein